MLTGTEGDTVYETSEHGCLLRTGYSVVGGPAFIPVKAAQWCMKPKMTDFLGLKIPGSEAVFTLCFHITSSALEISDLD